MKSAVSSCNRITDVLNCERYMYDVFVCTIVLLSWGLISPRFKIHWVLALCWIEGYKSYNGRVVAYFIFNTAEYSYSWVGKKWNHSITEVSTRFRFCTVCYIVCNAIQSPIIWINIRIRKLSSQWCVHLLCFLCAGSVLLRMSDLPNGQDCDNWHQLAIPGTRASKGNLRLVATFKHEVILPLEEYRAFSEVRWQSCDDMCQLHRLPVSSSLCSLPHPPFFVLNFPFCFSRVSVFAWRLF